jgi:hypothetical protein
MANYLKDSDGLFPAGTDIRSLNMDIVDNRLQMSGDFTINAMGMSVPVSLSSATFSVNDQGQMQLVGKVDMNIEINKLLKGRAETMAQGVFADIDSRLKQALSTQTPGWSADRFNIAGGKLGVQFGSE